MPAMSVDSSPMFELANVQSLLIWAIAEAILTGGWLLLQHRLPQRWYSLIQLVRLSAIPYFALISGQISPRLMGFSGYDWSNSLSIGSLLIVSVFALWIGIRVTEEANSVAVEATPEQLSLGMSLKWSINGLLLLTAGGWELNWAFWRVVFSQGVALLVAGIESPLYWGIACAVLFALLTLFFSALTPAARITSVAILIATSVLFLFTRNFWLCWFLHAMLQLASVRDARR